MFDYSDWFRLVVLIVAGGVTQAEPNTARYVFHSYDFSATSCRNIAPRSHGCERRVVEKLRRLTRHHARTYYASIRRHVVLHEHVPFQTVLPRIRGVYRDRRRTRVAQADRASHMPPQRAGLRQIHWYENDGSSIRNRIRTEPIMRHRYPARRTKRRPGHAVRIRYAPAFAPRLNCARARSRLSP